MSSDLRYAVLCNLHNKLQKIKKSYKLVTVFLGQKGHFFCANLQKSGFGERESLKKQGKNRIYWVEA